MAKLRYAHVNIPIEHLDRMRIVASVRGESPFGHQARFVRRAIETQLLIEEFLHDLSRDQSPLPDRAIHTLRQVLLAGIVECSNASKDATTGSDDGTGTKKSRKKETPTTTATNA